MTAPSGPAVCVVLCTYNEAECIRDVLSRLRGVFSSACLIVVDDDSPDGTAALARERADEVIVRAGRPRGRGWAGREGYDRALACGAPVIIEMDADGSHDPRDAERLAAALVDADLAVGVRSGPGADERSLPRRVLSAVAHVFLRMTLGLGISDPTSGFRAFRRELLEKIDPATLRARGPEIIEEVYAAARRHRAKIAEFGIRFHPRAAGVSKLTVVKLARVLMACVKIRLTGHA